MTQTLCVMRVHSVFRDVFVSANPLWISQSFTYNSDPKVTNFSGAAHSDRNVYDGAAELPPVPDVDAGR